MEIWKDVKGYEGLYQISSLGRVKSLERKVKHWRGGEKIVKEAIKKQYENKSGYFYIQLAKEGVNKTFLVHQLVAIAFLNHQPNGHDIVIDHKDDNKANNKLENIRLVSQKENINKSINRKRFKHRGSDNGNSKLNKESVMYIRNLDSNGVPRKNIASIMNVSTTTITEICNRKTWYYI